MLSIVTAAQETKLEEIPLPFGPWWFGLIAAILFAALFGFLWSFRGTALKHAPGHDTHIDDLPGTHVNTGHDTHTNAH